MKLIITDIWLRHSLAFKIHFKKKNKKSLNEKLKVEN